MHHIAKSGNAVSGLFKGIICLTLTGVMWTMAADAAGNPDVDAAYVGLYALFGGLSLLGGLWSMGKEYGMIKG